MTDYRPIDCATHSRYEAAILLRRRLWLRWRTSEGMVREFTVQPLDVIAKEGEEFLIVRDDGHNEWRLRLDHILEVKEIM